MIPRKIINQALRSINAIGTGEVPTSEMFEDARDALNLLLDSWSAEELLPQEFSHISFDLSTDIANYTLAEGAAADADAICVSQAISSGNNSLTIDGALASGGVATLDVPRHVTLLVGGAATVTSAQIIGTNTYGDVTSDIITGASAGGGTARGTKQFKTVTSITAASDDTGTISVGTDNVVNIRRPIKIESAYVRSSTGVDTPVLIKSRERWNEISDKDESGVPTKLFYDRLYPSGEIYIHPVPSVATYDLHLDLWLPFVQIDEDDVDTAWTIPGEYLRALKWNLATELAPEYGKKVSEFVYATAQESKNVIRKQNALPPKKLMSKTPVAIVEGQPAANTN